MKVVVIYPSDTVGGKEHAFVYWPKSENLNEVLDETRRAFENVHEDGLPAGLKIRTMLTGDVIQIGDDLHFIVTVSGFRPVSEASVTNWRKRTKVERMIGSGLQEKISSGDYLKVN